ncbi:hypothetical protein OROMI_013374 [Orobanche minor]
MTVDRSKPQEKGQLDSRKRQREAEPSIPTSAGAPVVPFPQLERPSRTPSSAFGKLRQSFLLRLHMGDGSSAMTGEGRELHRNNPNCSPIVLDFLTSNAPRDPCDIPHYVSRDLTNLMKACTIDLDAIALRWSPDSMQADLEVAQKMNVEFADKLVAMEKSSIDMAEKANQDADWARAVVDRMRAEVIEARRSSEVALKEAEAELPEASEELAGLRGRQGPVEYDPFLSLENISEFAYYMAYADAIRAAKKGGLEVGPLVEAFKVYVSEHPLHPNFLVPIQDLHMVYGVDLSWYQMVAVLIQPDVPGDAEPETIGGEAIVKPMAGGDEAAV